VRGEKVMEQKSLRRRIGLTETGRGAVGRAIEGGQVSDDCDS